jgi:hypothetical protein
MQRSPARRNGNCLAAALWIGLALILAPRVRAAEAPAAGPSEFAIRHISNAGLEKPNTGEDFLTLAYVF